MSEFNIGDKILVHNAYEGEVFGVDNEEALVYAVKYRDGANAIQKDLLFESALEKLPQFDIDDKVKWGRFVCIVKYVTPDKNNIDNEYEYVIKIIKSKDRHEGKYYFVLEGALEGTDK